jgi:hypothetical protein
VSDNKLGCAQKCFPPCHDERWVSKLTVSPLYSARMAGSMRSFKEKKLRDLEALGHGVFVTDEDGTQRQIYSGALTLTLNLTLTLTLIGRQIYSNVSIADWWSRYVKQNVIEPLLILLMHSTSGGLLTPSPRCSPEGDDGEAVLVVSIGGSFMTAMEITEFTLTMLVIAAATRWYRGVEALTSPRGHARHSVAAHWPGDSGASAGVSHGNVT